MKEKVEHKKENKCSYNFEMKGEGLVFGEVGTDYNDNANTAYSTVVLPDIWKGRKVAVILLEENKEA